MKEISVRELKQMIDEKADFQLIDVRDHFEYEMANLGGELIPLSEIVEQADKIDKIKKVIIHCRSGQRSGAAIMELEKRFGLENLYNLKGGIIAYAAEIDPSLSVI